MVRFEFVPALVLLRQDAISQSMISLLILVSRNPCLSKIKAPISSHIDLLGLIKVRYYLQWTQHNKNSNRIKRKLISSYKPQHKPEIV